MIRRAEALLRAGELFASRRDFLEAAAGELTVTHWRRVAQGLAALAVERGAFQEARTWVGRLLFARDLTPSTCLMASVPSAVILNSISMANGSRAKTPYRLLKGRMHPHLLHQFHFEQGRPLTEKYIEVLT